MNQRSASGRGKEVKRDKPLKLRKEDEDKLRREDPQAPKRSASERSLSAYQTSSYPSKQKELGNGEKTRSRSRDGHSSLIFRRQEHGRLFGIRSKGSTPENSPGRAFRDARERITGNGNITPPSRDFREVTPKRMVPSSPDDGPSEDSRLIRLVQRLERDEERERRVQIVKQLRDFFECPDNFKILSRNLQLVTSGVGSILNQRMSSELKTELIHCLGCFAYMLGLESKSFFDWIFATYNSAVTDDARIVLLKTLLETLQQDKDGTRFGELVPMVMTAIKSALEIADLPELLTSIVDVIMHISETCPSVFTTHFRDTVDILVGWHIDSSQALTLTQYTSNALISFRQYWVADINFSVTLLGQFLEDMDAYAEELMQGNPGAGSDSEATIHLSDVQIHPASECLAKISSLIRVFTTVLKSLGEHASPAKCSAISWDFLSESLKTLLSCMTTSPEVVNETNLLLAANECICLLLCLLQSHSVTSLAHLLSYLNIMLPKLGETSCDALVASLLDVVINFVREVNTQLPVDFITTLLAPTSPCQELRFSPSVKVQQKIFLLHHVILALKNVPLLEEAYKCLLLDLEASYSVLTGKEVVLVPGKQGSPPKYTLYGAQVALLSIVCSLAEIANTKHSIIGMWALKPNFFDLLTCHLDPTSEDLTTKYPAVHNSLIYILYSHCKRHGNFISSSTLITQPLSSPLHSTASGQNSPILPSVIAPPSSKHFSCILKLLTQLLKQKYLSQDARLLSLCWSQEIVEGVQQHFVQLIETKEFKEFISSTAQLALSVDSEVCVSSCKVLQAVLRIGGATLPYSCLRSCYEACVLNISSSISEVKEAFSILFSLLPLDIALSHYMPHAAKLGTHCRDFGLVEDIGLYSVEDLWEVRHEFMSRTPSTNFHSHNFRSIMAYILQGTQPKNPSWLWRMFYGCQRLDRQNKAEKLLMKLVALYPSILWYWATWESAQLCVMNKLRTPMGKPQETFTAIEATLKSYARDNHQDHAKTSMKGIGNQDELLRVHLLLDFLEHLEQLMYNSYEGCAIALPTPPKTVRTFFRTNKATCLEWLTRIRLAVTIVGIRSGDPATAVRHGYKLLEELQEAGNTQSADFDHVLVYIVKALISLRCPEAVLGLYVWCKEKLGHKFTWIKAAVDQAASRFENGVHEYSCILQSMCNLEQQSIPASYQEGKTSTLLLESLSIPKDESRSSRITEGKNMGKSGTDPVVKSFLLEQIVECYKSLGCWDEAVKWSEFQHQVKWNQNGTVLNCLDDYDLSYAKILSLYGDDKKTVELSESIPWERPSWEVRHHQLGAESLLLSCALKMEASSRNGSMDEGKRFSDDLKKGMGIIMNLIEASSMAWPPHIEPTAAALYLIANASAVCVEKGNKKINLNMLSKVAKVDPPDYCSSTLTQTFAWTNVWLHTSGKDPSFRSTRGLPQQDLLLVSSRLARKQQNLRLAQRLLLKYAQGVTGSKLTVPELKPMLGSESEHLRDVLKKIHSQTPSDSLIQIQREASKLMYNWGQSEAAIDTLLESVSGVNEQFPTSKKNDQSGNFGHLIARSLLSLVKYLQQDSKYLEHLLNKSRHPLEDSLSVSVLHTLIDLSTLKSGQQIGADCPSLQPDGVVGKAECTLGHLLHLSVAQAPSLAKAWSALAAWNYRWGRKAVDTSSDGVVDLLPEEKSEALRLLPQDAGFEEQEAVLSLLGQIHNTSEETEMPLDLVTGCPRADYFQKQLIIVCPTLQTLPDCKVKIDSLFQIWQNVMHRVYAYYRSAAKAYFRYLQLNGQSSEEKSEDGNVTATLRLLRLVVKHASELRDVLEEGLAKTPTSPWRGIIPQLFSRLSHPEHYVRQSISDLLCRVAQAAPHLIVFPAVVGSLTLNSATNLKPEATQGLFGTYLSQELKASGSREDHPEGSPMDQNDLSSTVLPEDDDEEVEDEEEEEEQHQNAAIMQNCFVALVETLGQQNARIIAEVKTLVHELRRITLLWDELWSGTLSLHHPELARRILTLEDEIKKVVNNPSLSKEEKMEIIKEKHYIFMKPTIFVLEQLLAITSQPAETPHERWFQETFRKQIEETIAQLTNPHDPSQPQHSFSLYKQLHQALQQRVHHQARSHLLIDQISPVLASLKSTVIPMPGLGIKSSSIVAVETVHSHISILPTKTKPKKLAFYGSDGRKYTYLFKGLEDLHLDERIMQFLSIVNNMFVKAKRYGKVVYYARHYSVTPLGPRSGLIQWVDGATPLFGLYKRWQQREAVAQALKNQSSSLGSSFVTPSILRPSEIYYNKLTPLLKEKGISNLENRKEWPLSVLLQVLKELMEETPNDLLAKELWCSCSSALNYWEVSQTYGHSTAVMSMIGYIIGLGDRHLDNVLVDLATGEVVHIDYNVCFEKGKNLRVPEKVPFRMTPNIQTALGISGIEGTFRVSCEHVMKVLRRGRETLLTLLEAFVYDPLVDWTPGNEGGYTGAVYGGGQTTVVDAKQSKQLMERKIAQSMLAVRVAEMKAEWCKNRDDLVSALPTLESALQSYISSQAELHAAENNLQEACQQRALLEEALNNPNHGFYNLPTRFKEFARVKATLASAKDSVKEKMLECKKWHNLHKMSLKAICGQDLAKWCADVASELHTDTLSVASVVEFLQSAGQSQLIQQCEHTESELGAILQQHRLALRNCVDLLTTYATIVIQYPPCYREHNRSYQWLQWLELLLSDFTVSKCQEVISEFHSKYGVESLDMASIQAAVSVKYQLQSIIGDINTKLVNVLERRRLEGVEDMNVLSCAVSDARSRILRFVKENGMEGNYSVCCVLMTVLCALNKRLLMMEGAAASAGDCLVDLTSWGGDWFVDDIYSMNSNITQLISILQDNIPNITDELKASHQAVIAANAVFGALQDLSLNFQNIILPEAMKNIQAEEHSVIDMIGKLNHIIDTCGMPLEELIVQLEVNIRNIVMEIPVPSGNAMKTVRILETSFEALLSGRQPHISDLSPGQMLLMGLNGLFTKLDSDMGDFLASLDLWTPPATWRKVDVVREARGLVVPIHLVSTRSLLKDIFFVKRLQVMQQFFSLCQMFSLCLSLKNPVVKESVLSVPTDDQLYRPIKAFIGEYIRKQMLGISSQTVAYYLCQVACALQVNVTAEIELKDVGAESKVSLEDIGKKTVDVCLKQGRFQPGQLTQAGTLVGNLDASWRKDDLGRRLEHTVMLLKASLQRGQLQLARHHWWHEDLLTQGNVGLQNMARPARATVMSEIRKTMQAMLTLESSLSSSQERYLNLNASVEQRLKWAAGANPALASVQEEFEAAIAEKTALVTSATQLSRELVNLCNAILNFEALRTRTSEALSSDGTFLSLINRCQESCMLAENCRSQVSSIEEKLLSIKPITENGRVNKDWIMGLLNKVSQSLAAVKEKLDEKKNDSTAKWDEVKNQTLAIRGLLSTHHHLMSEVRNILKSLAKHEEQELGTEAKTVGVVHTFFISYRSFSEQISSLIRDILAESDGREVNRAEKMLEQLNPMVKTVQKVYKDLMVMAGPLGASSDYSLRTTERNGGDKSASENSSSAKSSGSVTCAPDLLCDSSPTSQGQASKAAGPTVPTAGSKKSSVIRDPRTGKAVQERNSYATNVWRRVKMKLDGRDPDISKRSTISEQVDFVIREATSLENLAVLYEGWTPWV